MLIMESIILPNVSFLGRHGFLLISFGLLLCFPFGFVYFIIVGQYYPFNSLSF